MRWPGVQMSRNGGALRTVRNALVISVGLWAAAFMVALGLQMGALAGEMFIHRGSLASPSLLCVAGPDLPKPQCKVANPDQIRALVPSVEIIQ